MLPQLINYRKGLTYTTNPQYAATHLHAVGMDRNRSTSVDVNCNLLSYKAKSLSH